MDRAGLIVDVNEMITRARAAWYAEKLPAEPYFDFTEQCGRFLLDLLIA